MLTTPFTGEISSIPSNFALGSIVAGEKRENQLASAKPAVPYPTLPVTHVWGADFSVVDMEQTLDFCDQIIASRTPSYLITANLNYLMLCDSNERLQAFTKKAAAVLCDGMPILWRSWFGKRPLPERVAGADLIFALADRSASKSHRVFLMGGAEGVAQAAADKLRELYPKLIICGVECPPFRQPTPAEHDALIQRIRAARPDILFVAFGQPKGEYWIEENYRELGVPISIQLGASFDFIAGTAVRAPVVLQKIGLEWLYRATKDPKRLIPRYAKNAWFLLKLLFGRTSVINSSVSKTFS